MGRRRSRRCCIRNLAGAGEQGRRDDTTVLAIRNSPGNISGVVMMDGKPLANARVGLMDIAEIKSKAGKREKGADRANAGQKAQRPQPVATTMTDADGKFALTDVKVGQYVVMAGVKGEGRGRARATIAAGENATVEIQVTQNAGGHAGKSGAPKVKPNKAGKVT